MKAAFELTGEPRPVCGRAVNRRLRRNGKVPAVMYGGGKEPLPLAIDHSALLRQIGREAFYTSIITLDLNGEKQQVVVKEVQRHPVKPLVLHLDFQRVVEDQEITLYVPIHFLGEAVAKGVKEQGGEIQHLMTEVEVICLPRYLPEYLELDVSQMELNDILHLSDIPLPEGVALVALRQGHDHPVVAINPPRREEEEAPGAETPAGEVPAAAQGSSEPSSSSS
ncbi:MAG TPA: 50S ribosomal protein L25/general stress protein Ctc [Gammaproteobacteria bacterium]